MRARHVEGKTSCHNQVRLELMFEIGGCPGLHLVVVAFGDDVFRGVAGDGVPQDAVGVIDGGTVVHIGEIKAVPVELSRFRIAFLPVLEGFLVLSGTGGMIHQIAGQVLIVIGTWVGGFTPFECGLSARSGKEECRGGELRLRAGGPVPGQLCEGLVVTAHA